MLAGLSSSGEHASVQGVRGGLVAADGSPLVCNLPLVLGTPGIRVLPPGRPPTHITLMPTRYWDMVYTLAGRRAIQVPLIAVEGNAFGPSAAVDDVGSYYLVPALSALFAMPIARSADVFYGSAIGLAFLAGVIGFFRLFKRRLARAISLIGLLALALAALKIGDVYSFFFVTAAFTVPWLLILCRDANSSSWWLLFFLVLGLLIGVANAVRSYSGTAALLFACGMVIFQLTAETKRKLLFLLCLGIGLLGPKVLFTRAVAERDAFLRAQCPGYTALAARHLVWHAAYLGLGFLQNDYGISWNDALSYQKVQSIAPGTGFGSAEYERILRQQVLSTVRHDPWFVFLTVASKIGVVLVVFLLSANLGLIAAMVRRKPRPIDLCFALAITFNSLFALVVKPMPQYMLGLAAFSAFYGIFSLGFFLEPGVFAPRVRMSARLATQAAVA
jgi:hypothetical protein